MTFEDMDCFTLVHFLFLHLVKSKMKHFKLHVRILY